MGYNTIPNEEEVLKLLELKSLSREYAIRCLDANKHNHVTTCYYLILKKLEREGKIEVSKYYQSTTTMHPISLHGSRENSLVPGIDDGTQSKQKKLGESVVRGKQQQN